MYQPNINRSTSIEVFAVEMVVKHFNIFVRRAADISDVCDTLLSNETLTDVESLAQFIIDRLDGQCIDLDYEKAVEDTRQTNWNDSAVVRGDRQWMYQKCI